MKRKRILNFSIFIIVLMTIIVTCDPKPTAPQRANPFDPNNPVTGGDPFHLTAKIAGGGITLEWKKPDFKSLKSYKIYRSAQETSGYSAGNRNLQSNTVY